MVGGRVKKRFAPICQEMVAKLKNQKLASFFALLAPPCESDLPPIPQLAGPLSAIVSGLFPPPPTQSQSRRNVMSKRELLLVSQIESSHGASSHLDNSTQQDKSTFPSLR